jgi:hypothetical protein
VRTENFLERLNAQAASMGQKPVTERMLEDWAYEHLITGPTIVSGSWDRSEESLAEAGQVLEYRARGFERVSAIRSQCWLENIKFQTYEIRKDLITEFKRARNFALRRISSIHGFRMDITLTEYRRAALRGQLGPLDPVFKDAGFDFGPAVIILFYELARFGEQISPIDKETEPVAALIQSAVLPNGVHLFAGVFETDDEHPLSVVRAIRQLTNQELEQCRTLAELMPLGLLIGRMFFGLLNGETDPKYLAFSAALNSWSRSPWRIVGFASVANIYYHLTLKDADMI